MNRVPFKFVPELTGTTSPVDVYIANADTRIVADGFAPDEPPTGPALLFDACRNASAGNVVVTVSVSGYVVDCTSGSCTPDPGQCCVVP